MCVAGWRCRSRLRDGAIAAEMGNQPLTLGDRIVIPQRLEPGQSCRAEYRGSSWTARNVDQQAIDAGKEAVISNVDGLTLHVRAA